MTFFETTFTVQTAKKGGIFLLMALFAIGGSACDFTEGRDEDPNQPGEAPPDLVLNSAEIATIVYHEGDRARVTSFLTEQLNGASAQYGSEDRPSYNLTAAAVDDVWITAYADAIGELKVVKEEAKASDNSLLLGIAQTLESLNFGMTTALHGSVPYEEVGKNLNPRFQEQLAIYDGVIQELDTAVVNLQEGGASPGEKDEFYGGDGSAWVKAARTIQARYMLHVAHVDESPVGQYTFEQVYRTAEEGISSPAGNLEAPHDGAKGENANLFWLFRDELPGQLNASGSYAARLLDPDATLYRGTPNTTNEAGRFETYFTKADGSYDMADANFYASTADYPIVTHVENELIKAEAALHSDNRSFGDALAALNSARTANEQKYGGPYVNYSEDNFEDGGLLNPDGNMSKEEALLKEILEEKYVSLISNVEAYNDLRRTENFIGVQDPNGEVVQIDGQGFPQRFPIAQNERSSNSNTPPPSDLPGVTDPTPANQASYPTP